MNTKNNFIAGKTALNYNQWQKITSDKWVLKTICGYSVELERKPKQENIPSQFKFNHIEMLQIEEELERFLNCKIIEKVDYSEPNEYLSNIFTRPKKEGKIRVILNLKYFNEQYMDHIHFKMETLKSAVDSMRPNCYFGSVDLSEAFYSIPIRTEDRKYFRFIFNNQKYQFSALVMGLATSPRVFTKILKPVFANLRAKGFISTAYIDDSCLQGSTFDDCYRNILVTVKLMDALGLTVHVDKSVLIPSKQIVFLGFLLCSETMTVRLTVERVEELIECCSKIVRKSKCSIRKFAQMIGKMVAAEQGVEYAPLFYKPLEKVKDYYLRLNKGNFDHFMKISTETKALIQWWICNIAESFKKVTQKPPQMVLYTDASLKGWGAFNKSSGSKTGGQWSVDEQNLHINILELKACQLALLSFCKDIENTHVRIFMDNTTSCAYINKLGGKTNELDTLAREIWFWCLDRHIHLSAAHLPGKNNHEADELSRNFNDDLEWSLAPEIFEEILSHYPDMSVDLFASRLNYKLSQYISRRPEPDAMAVDAFSIVWTDKLFYIFAPFSLMAKILQKMEQDQTEAVVIAPIWPTQAWWASLLQMVSGPCQSLPKPQDILSLPHKPERRHPLKKMRLGVFRLSGKHSNIKEYRKMLRMSSSHHGETLQSDNMTPILNNGCYFVDEVKIQLNPL